MTTLQLRDFPRDDAGKLAVGEGGNETSRHQHSIVTSHKLPSFVQDVKREILQALYQQPGEVVSRAQIAKLVARKKSPWLIDNIEELVRRGYVHKTEGRWKNGCQMFFYHVAA